MRRLAAGRRSPRRSRGVLLWVSLACLGSGAPFAHVDASACAPTAADSEGPFYKPGAPARARTGRGLTVMGRVQSSTDCRPLAGARIEWWSADRSGRYADTLRATVIAGDGGAYRYETLFPSGYGVRPPHLHVKVSAAGHRSLTTQIYPERGQTEIVFDFNLVPE